MYDRGPDRLVQARHASITAHKLGSLRKLGAKDEELALVRKAYPDKPTGHDTLVVRKIDEAPRGQTPQPGPGLTPGRTAPGVDRPITVDGKEVPAP